MRGGDQEHHPKSGDANTLKNTQGTRLEAEHTLGEDGVGHKAPAGEKAHKITEPSIVKQARD
jgi:hypothetical protein